MNKKITIPFFATEEEVQMSIKEIKKSYINEFNITGSELVIKEKEIFDNGMPKTGKYVYGVDIIFEKRKEGVKEFLIDELKEIYEKNEIQNKYESTSGISFVEIFPNIDYKYWMNLNQFYSDAPLLPTMKICLINFASMPGLINDVLQNIEIMSCKELVSIIENDIKSIVKNNLFEDKNKMLRVFDLINGWGGKMGKATYVKPKGNTTRNSSNDWFSHYVSGAKKAIKGENQGLNEFTRIPNVGDSFGTKHLYFWSLYGGNRPIPIYDARIKTLLYLSIDAAPSFEQYVDDMVSYCNLKNISIEQLEKALFAFSSNYFPNESLIIKKEILDKTDYDEAKRLENLYQLNN